MSELEIFTSAGDGLDVSHFGLTDEGVPYVIAGKFAKALGYAKTQNATDQLDEAEKGHADVVTPGGRQRVGVIYEDGIWELIFPKHAPCGDVSYGFYADFAHHFVAKETVVNHTWGSCSHYTLRVTARGIELIKKRLAGRDNAA